MVSRSSRQVRGRISPPISKDATASARCQPNQAMDAAASSTAADPSASLTTSRNAARMFGLVPCVWASTAMLIEFPARPTMPNTSMAVEAT